MQFYLSAGTYSINDFHAFKLKQQFYNKDKIGKYLKLHTRKLRIYSLQ